MDLEDLRAALTKPAEQIIVSDAACRHSATLAETAARWTASHLDERESVVARLNGNTSTPIWGTLESLWSSLAESFAPSSTTVSAEGSRIALALAMAKWERNMVAGLENHQKAALQHEAKIRSLIFNLTTFSRIEDERFFTLHAVLTQLLSNLISPISAEPESAQIANEKLTLYLSGTREDDVIVRLLDSQDSKTNTATLHLIANITRDSEPHLRLLLSEAGLRWLTRILSRMDDWLEAQDGRFELACTMFTNLIAHNLQSTLFNAISIPNEPISPSQTTLLKLLDSHLASPHTYTNSTKPDPNTFLIPLFHLLSAYCLTSMKHVSDDARLPKVYEGLILVVEGLCSIGLAVQARIDAAARQAPAGQDESEEVIGGSEEGLVRKMNDSNEDEGIIKPLIELLRELNIFLPRLKPSSTPSNRSDPLPDVTPISTLKRNLVRLLGILTFNDKSTSDLVRHYGGVEMILGMTEVDELNPYLREHALFAVRNLMLGNVENQAVVDRMDPVGVIGEDGEVLPLPEKMRRQRRAGATLEETT